MKVIDKASVCEFITDNNGEERRACLFRLDILGSKKFGIYISTEEGADFCVFDSTLQDAEELFDKLEDGKLSPLHLEDIVSDFLHKKIFFWGCLYRKLFTYGKKYDIIIVVYFLRRDCFWAEE